MENELKKWQEITAGNPSAGRTTLAAVQKYLDGGHIQAKSTGGAPSDAIRKARLVALATNILMKRLGDFPEPVMPEAKPYPSPSNAQFAPIRVGSLSELTQLAVREHNGQLESPRSEWKPPIAKNERLTDDERLQKALDAARRDDPLSQVGQPVH